jgi:diguanylate cyclase (GGDEF)-like protein
MRQVNRVDRSEEDHESVGVSVVGDAAAAPASEEGLARLEALRPYDVLDTAPEPAFDHVTRLAAQVCRTPFALLSFFDERRQWNKSNVGWNIGEIALPDSPFGEVVEGGGALLIVPDAREDEGLRANRYVTGAPSLRFLAAVPLLADSGQAVGALCVLDEAARLLDDAQVDALRMLGQQTMTLLEQRRAIREMTLAVSHRSDSEEQARWQARHDMLTGLPNRTLFLERVEQALARAQVRQETAGAKTAKEGTMAVLFVDLDRFKRINDTLGHAAGDVLLREVAARFSGCLRPEDTLARLGGDEFTVLLPDVPTPGYAASVSQMMLRTLRRPVLLGTQELHVGASIGVSMYPRDGQDAQTLLKHADIAMYQAKAKGGYQSYSPRMNADSYQRLIEEGELRRAIEREELTLCYQPQVDLATGEVRAVEALARWRHPDRGPVPPAHFIQIAEQADLIVPLGELILRGACRDAAALRAEGWRDLRVAVNVSARQLTQPRLLESIRSTLTHTGLSGDVLDLELTETALAGGGDTTPQTLQELRAMGIRLSVDDFGTGYSSLAYLRRFAVDMLKIDRAFVAGLGKDTPDEALVRASVEMGHALGLKVIAEGVETEEQLEALRRLGCDLVQGYLYSRPVTLEGLRTLLAANRAGASAAPPVRPAPRPRRRLTLTAPAAGAKGGRRTGRSGAVPDAPAE